MEEALVSVTTGALQTVMAKLAALLDNESKLSDGVRAEVELHTHDLTAIEAFILMKSVEEDASAQDSAWMKEVWELSYDIEDELDEFMAPVGDKTPANPDGFMDKIKTMLDRTKAHHQIASAIDDLKKKQVGQVAKRYKARQSGASNGSNAPKVDPRALTIFEGMSKLVDVDGHKKELIQLLFDCDSTQQQPNIVAVVGLGGLGKTTLANQVYQDLKGQFECHVFVSVSSQNPDVVKVMRAIYRQLNEKYSPGMEDLQQLITMISDFLTNKRYFIVVDDIWDVETWKAIMCAFPTISFGSKIMITTRIDDVAQSCCSSFSGHIYNIRPLSMVHSRKLFYERLFDPQEKCPSQLEGISGQIFNKCASLPLAIIVISGVLAHRASEKELWEQVKDSISHALRNSTIEDMVNIISLSYMDLPPHLKTCLLYLSIFPKDHAIEKENLIRRWIGEGFIHKRDGYTLHESGEMCFNELINRGLIHPTEIDSTFGDEVKSCRLHDTIFNFIVSKAVEENFVTIIGVPAVVNPDPKGKVHRVSLQNDGEIPLGLDVSHARSLHVFGRNAKIPSLLECPLLHVLDFNECMQLKDDHLAGVGNLLHLKYLRFKHAHSLTKLPEQVARLQHLEIDIHGFNKVMEIPVTIQQRLTCHVTLLVDGYETVPDEVAEMQVLRVLEGLNVYTQSMQFLERLGQLKNLWKLGIIFNNYDAGDYWEEHGDEIIYSICELSKAGLESLHICMNEATDEYFEGPWFPHPSCGLRELVIHGGGVTKVPAWMTSLIKLEKLHIPMDAIAEQDVEILEGLPSLRHLCIEHDEDEELELKDAMEKAMEEHPNRPTLVWKFYE